MRGRIRVTALLLALTLQAFAVDVGAQEANDKAAADMLFEQARTLISAGKFAEACPKLEESLRLDSGIGTMLYLAECWEKTGKTASAWAQFREAESSAAKLGDPRSKVAHDRAERLAPLLSDLNIRVTSPPTPGLVVTRDGHAVGQVLWGNPTPIDPGSHAIKASATGYQTWETTILVGARSDHAKVTVPALGALTTAAPPVSASSFGWQRGVGLGLAGVGVVGAGLGAFFGLRAISKNNEADTHCPSSGCDPQGLGAADSAKSAGTISTIAFAAGAVFLAGGLVLFFTAPKSTRAAVGALGPGLSF
jgi:serine/threonine-protein kinase